MPRGKLFESFDEAWESFLRRREPLEDFFSGFPADEFEDDAWVIEPSPAIKSAAAELQRPLAEIDWLRLLPEHFLHVSLPVPGPELRGRGPFELEYRGVTCFHETVVVQVDAPSLGAIDPRPTFLPHMTLAITTREGPPDELRDIVIGMRAATLGRDEATEAIRIAFPFSRERLLEPWTVQERIQLK
jgi:hypothetical protein